jgi:hypothetical protein
VETRDIIGRRKYLDAYSRYGLVSRDTFETHYKVALASSPRFGSYRAGESYSLPQMALRTALEAAADQLYGLSERSFISGRFDEAVLLARKAAGTYGRYSGIRDETIRRTMARAIVREMRSPRWKAEPELVVFSRFGAAHAFAAGELKRRLAEGFEKAGIAAKVGVEQHYDTNPFYSAGISYQAARPGSSGAALTRWLLNNMIHTYLLVNLRGLEPKHLEYSRVAYRLGEGDLRELSGRLAEMNPPEPKAGKRRAGEWLQGEFREALNGLLGERGLPRLPDSVEEAEKAIGKLRRATQRRGRKERGEL